MKIKKITISIDIIQIICGIQGHHYEFVVPETIIQKALIAGLNNKGKKMMKCKSCGKTKIINIRTFSSL